MGFLLRVLLLATLLASPASCRSLAAKEPKCVPEPDLATAGLSLYPGSDSPLAVSGRVTMSSDGTVQTFYFDLDGLDTGCTEEFVGSGLTGNACGIHIHSGFTCDDASLVGGHYFVPPASDPWSDALPGYVAYYSTKDGSAEGVFEVDTGATSQDILGRAFVVHDATGARVACGLMVEAADPLCVGKLQTYPGYEGLFPDAKGKITMVTVDGTTQYVEYKLNGLDTGCAGGYNAEAANSCGLHIHSGSTCQDAALVGGHYFAPDFVDPWTEKSLSYVASTRGRAKGSLSAVTGGTSLDVIGRAFVVHGYDGGRIACGLIDKCPKKCVPMPGKGGNRPGL